MPDLQTSFIPLTLSQAAFVDSESLAANAPANTMSFFLIIFMAPGSPAALTIPFNATCLSIPHSSHTLSAIETFSLKLTYEKVSFS